MKNVKKILGKVPGMLWGVWALILLFAIFAPGFASFQNIQNILKNTSILLILACGMTLVIVSRQLDLSIGGVATFAGMVAGYYIQPFEIVGPLQIVIALVIGLAIGAAFGAFNGIMIGVYKYNYWLVTFATMSIGFALAQVITGGNIISGFAKGFRNVANIEILRIPGVVWFAFVIVTIMAILSYRTRFGMRVYAIGNSEQCASQSGVNVPQVRVIIYLIAGMLAGIGGVLLAAKTNSASPISATGFEFDAVAAVVVGGTPMAGGKGGILGTVIGAFSISAMKTGLQLIGFSNYTQQVFIGLIILIIIVVDVLQAKRARSLQTRRVYK